MPRKHIYLKQEIPKWYKKRIKDFEELNDIQAIYYYERIKLEDRVRKARKKGYQYNLEPRKEKEQITQYDVADVEAITRADFTKTYGNFEEAEYWLNQLEEYTLTEAENQAQGWIDLKAYKSKDRGGPSKGGQWLAENTRRAGDKIVNKIEEIKSNQQRSIQVYEYYLKGTKFQAMKKRVEKVLADSNTATGKYGELNQFLQALSTSPITAKESQQSEALGQESSEDDEIED